MIIAQITDLHVTRPGILAYGITDTAARLAAVVERLAEFRPVPDAVLVTGDLVDDWQDFQAYTRTRALLAPLKAPLYVIPGNHDSREGLRAAFGELGYLPAEGFLHYTVETLPVRLVMLDTLVPGRGGGALCAERLVWLEARLAEQPDRPTVVVMHHPPFLSGIGYMDALGFDGMQAFAEIMRRSTQVERILCGHMHRPIEGRVGGVPCSVSAATAQQLVLDIRVGATGASIHEPPAFRIHFWQPDGGLVSHTQLVADFGPVQEFG